MSLNKPSHSPDILYLAHDLGDPAVRKRVAMLQDGGARLRVAGFRRAEKPFSDVAGCAPIDLGRTHNGRFAQRACAVLRQVLSSQPGLSGGADIIVARNLEMLAVAARVRASMPRPPVLIYECLDIHRLLLNDGLPGAALRRLEGWLAAKASALITSSPAFVGAYFSSRSRVRLPVRLIENKVYDPAGGMEAAASPSRPAGPPWKIGWFGVIRCRKSLLMLADLVARSQGKVEVVIRGRPALDQIPDFHDIVSQTPGIRFFGAYRYPDDLPEIYGGVHFTWAVDFYEDGSNSSWLLPNRLYEGGLFNAVPIAVKSVVTGDYLDRLNIGVTLGAPVSESLSRFFGSLTADRYRSLESRSAEAPRSQWRHDQDECRSLVRYLASLQPVPSGS